MADEMQPVPDQIEIDVRYEPDHEAPTMVDGRPMLTFAREYVPGSGWVNGWRLWYLDDPGSQTAGVDDYFIVGDLDDVDQAVADARRYLAGPE